MKKKILIALSYVLTIALTCLLTVLLTGNWQRIWPENKLTELETLLDQYYVDDLDKDTLYDAAASAMVDALPDRWSYYISAEEYAAYLENKNNAYVGIGITVQAGPDGLGMEVIKVAEGSGAYVAGVQPGDVVIGVDDQDLTGMDMDAISALIKGEAGTTVKLTVRRAGENVSMTVERKLIRTPVATATMLENNVGLVTIANFNTNCANESIAAVKQLLEQGATALIFDVRNNGGGYTDEMVRLLDYLLPEGPLFRTVDYSGKESVSNSNASCVDVPMAVLINGNSYSAAEFFAAALEEYEAAVVVGEKTSGKGFYQMTYQMKDGSAVAISSGRYFTPNGVSLEGVGLTPKEEYYVTVDDETAAAIFAGILPPMEDPQILVALAALGR